MKKVLVFLLGFFLTGAYAADSLPVVKKRIASKMRACMLDTSTGGNSYVNVCRLEAAENFEKAAWGYAENNLVLELKEGYEEPDVVQNNYVNDIAWFRAILSTCNSFEASIKPSSWQDSYHVACRLYWARQAAEYFYRPSEKEIKASVNRSWSKTVDDWIRKEIY
ncbi:hypothetical protein [Neisseria dentiae]|uniref:hypothetical protein n=1 Tax=Neisseria dentiae TaxID=194197 RepID=UPI00211CDC24|nr:hypothetical protein [Neisseria dentiae]MCQ9325547.1 hypothetical protein [Neisseria dentiae]